MDFSQQITEQVQQRVDDRTALRKRLRAEHIDVEVPENIADEVFSKAWEDGHADGEHMVEQEYGELAALVNAAFRAGTDYGYC